MRKNIFLTFCFACVPGAGQMYQGYMKRGLSQMSIFAGVCGVMMLLQFSALGFALPVLFAYSFFDTFRIRNQSAEQAAQNQDDYLIHLSGLFEDSAKELLAKRHTLIGWGCIGLGSVLLYGNFVRPMAWRFLESSTMGRWVFEIINALPQLLLIGALIVLGIYLLRGPKAAKTEDFVSFKGDHHGN